LNIRVEALYNQGSCRIAEDGYVISYPYFCVADGVSAPHDQVENPPLIYRGGLTGGQMAVKQIQTAFSSADPEDSLRNILVSANRKIMAEHLFCHGILPRETERMGAAAFVAAKLEKNSVFVIQGGDCFAVLKTKDNGFRVTRNQVFRHDLVLKERIEDLRQKYGNDKQVWYGLRPLMIEMRKAHANQLVKDGYAVLNGQSDVAKCWNAFRMPVNNLQYLLLFSDGFVPFKRTEDEMLLGDWVVNLYEKGGLLRVLQETRTEEKSARENPYFAEATALAVTFIF
jgi:serine/threonine protein phosphatase PrpC